jgi:hypothetical protein
VIVTLAVFGGGLYILWVVLNSYIAPEKPSERKDLVQAFAVIAGGIIALGTLLIGWLNLRHNQRALSVQQSNTEATLRQQRLIEEERAQDAALQAYLERMGELLLLGQEKEAEARYLVQMHTHTVLRRVTGECKGSILRLLYGLKLIGYPPGGPGFPGNPIIAPNGADLHEAKLEDADLRRANLSGSNLEAANLSGTNLKEANLRRANLSKAILSGADLSDAVLDEADLTNTVVSRAELDTCHSLEGVDIDAIRD